MDRPPRTDPGRRTRPHLALALALLPSLSAVALVPGFVTQDGPAHAYNAHVLVGLLRPGSPFADAFTLRWAPVPNWAGHALLSLLVAILPARAADRLMMALTLIGLAVATAWLRGRVAGEPGRGEGLAAAWSALVGLNVAWLFGFTSFLLGACLLPITLGVWWSGRERLGPARAAGVAGLLVLGYFCHPVSLGLTAVGLVVLALTTPGVDRRRLRWTGASLAVLVPLGLLYRGLSRSAGPLRPSWNLLRDYTSPAAWWAQAGWVDPISLARKTLLPLAGFEAAWGLALAPVVWFGLGAALLALATLRGRGWTLRERRGWWLLAGLLLAGGLLGPDRLGEGHGDYLPQRVALLGLVVLLPALAPGAPAVGWSAQRTLHMGGVGLLWIAVGLQSAFVWDYALRSERLIRPFVALKPAVGRGQRVGTLLIDLKQPYRSNPLRHADCLLGIGNGNVIWADYEAAHYYFPVHFRPDVPHPPELEFEAISVLDGPADAQERARRWRALLEGHHTEIDRLVVRGADPTLDAITARWFEPLAASGPVRVLRHR